MEIIALDLHKRETQRSIKADDGTITDRRIATSRERFTAVFGERPRARILLEASTESEWVARHLESLGHEVIVADPNDAPMYANRSRRTKTDKRDVDGRVRDGRMASGVSPVRSAPTCARGTRGARCARADADAVPRAGESAGATRWAARADESERVGPNAHGRVGSLADVDDGVGAARATSRFSSSIPSH